MTGQQVTHPPAPGTDDWRRMITASKIPAMIRDGESGDYLGLGYTDAYTLYHEMTGQAQADLPDERILARGHWMEASGREFWLYENPGWRISKKEIAFTDPDLPFPNLATLDARASKGRSRGIVEVKAPRKDQGVHDKWLLQVMFQLGITGFQRADVVLMPQWGEERIVPIEFDPDLYAAIVADAEHFWNLIEAGTPPAAGASEYARDVYAARNPAPVDEAVDLTTDLMDRWTTALAASATAETELAVVENLIAEEMGDRKKATFDGTVVANRSAGRFAKSRLPKTDEAKAAVEASTISKPTLDTKLLKKNYPDLYEAGVANPGFAFKRSEWS